MRSWSRLQFTALNGRKDPAIVKLLWQIHQEGRSLMTAFESSEHDRGVYRENQYAASLDSVCEYLSGYPNLHSIPAGSCYLTITGC
ncbi:MAG: hypothetical protein FJ295_15790 [Planctomycetes bacterium]|nr:hypothetical protein [Planctomycetota bacterium]